MELEVNGGEERKREIFKEMEERRERERFLKR